jgi:hypothetical protein
VSGDSLDGMHPVTWVLTGNRGGAGLWARHRGWNLSSNVVKSSLAKFAGDMLGARRMGDEFTTVLAVCGALSCLL